MIAKRKVKLIDADNHKGLEITPADEAALRTAWQAGRLWDEGENWADSYDREGDIVIDEEWYTKAKAVIATARACRSVAVLE